MRVIYKMRVLNECDEASSPQVTNRASRKRPLKTPGSGMGRRRRRNQGLGGKPVKANNKNRESRQARRGLSMLGDPSQLVYLDSSPNFCRKNKFGVGTRGRACERGEGCRHLCCGRGYDTTLAEVTEPCQCHVRWCCEVLCKNCTRQAELYMCK